MGHLIQLAGQFELYGLAPKILICAPGSRSRIQLIGNMTRFDTNDGNSMRLGNLNYSTQMQFHEGSLIKTNSVAFCDSTQAKYLSKKLRPHYMKIFNVVH